MKKTSLSFRALRAGSYLHRFFLSKKSSRLRNAAVVVAASISISVGASAQCNTFHNANAANPLNSVIDKTKTIGGFAFADIDGDGDLDVYLNYYDTSYIPKPSELHLFRNIGTKTHPFFREDTLTGFGNQLAGRNNGFMQFVDIDGDGDLDYYVSEDAQGYYSVPRLLFYKNEGTAKVPNFVQSNDDPAPHVSSYIFQPFAFADVDGDGDYDMYASDVTPYGLRSYGQRVYFNIGSKTNPVFGSPVYNSIDRNFNRTYYDWNKDGLLDFFGIHDFGVGTDYNKNVGPKEAPQYVKAPTEAPDFNLTPPYRMVDLNNDGAPEIFDFGANYSTLAPVAVIGDSLLKNGNTALFSKNQAAVYKYQWEYNGNIISGATSYYIIPKKPGKYTLYVANACGVGGSLIYKLENNTLAASATGDRMDDTKEHIVSIKAYPNPFGNSFSLQLSGTVCTVKITDMAGRVLLIQNTSAATLQTGGTLKAGSYIVQVWQGKELIYTTTIIKQ